MSVDILEGMDAVLILQMRLVNIGIVSLYLKKRKLNEVGLFSL